MNSSPHPTPPLDFIALGEAVVDLISDEHTDTLANAAKFERFAGGQASNLTVTLARLGKRAAVASCVGDDGLGDYYRQKMADAGALTDYIQITPDAPTTIVLVSRETQTPDFIVFRGADAHLQATPALLDAIAHSRIVHTSAFALARQPARNTILQGLRHAQENGALVTLDPNYHPRVWPDTDDFKGVIREAFQFAALTKPSLDDCVRLFGAGLSPAEYAARFLSWGAQVVIVTMGGEGVHLALHDGSHYRLIPNPTPVADVTGAGDSFWGGYLSAHLAGKTPLEAACFGQAVAEIKISKIGPIETGLDWGMLTQKAQAILLSVIR